MKYYKLLQLYKLISNERLRIFSIGLLFLFRRRFLNVFFDPSLSCNFRCLMCYFSDPNFKNDSKKIPLEDLPLLARHFFSYALKLQIGCGAEPTTYRYNLELIRLAKQEGVPYVSFTTNGYLLNQQKISDLLTAGLDEITLSMHGASREVYEKLMPGSNFDKFILLLEAITEVKKKYPKFKLRINYTVNPDNLEDLSNFDAYIDKYGIDVVQIRPIRKLGNSIYADFDLKRKEELYLSHINRISDKCRRKGLIYLITNKLSDSQVSVTSLSALNYTYCYISPNSYGNKNYNLTSGSYLSFLRKTGFLKQVLRACLIRKNDKQESDFKTTDYDVNM